MVKYLFGGLLFMRITKKGKRKYLAAIFAFAAVLCGVFCFNVNMSEASEPLVVVIDPGHGGYDPGAVVTENDVKYEEKVFNLKIAEAIREELGKYEGVSIYLTREENDSGYMTLAGRIAFAKQKGAEVLVSVHNNSSSPSAKGCMAMVPNGNYNKARANESLDLSRRILDHLKSIGLDCMDFLYRSYEPERKITYPNGKNSDYYGIIRGSMIEDITGVLIEYQFMTNSEDLARLKDDAKLKQFGKVTAEAIAEKYGLHKGPNTEPVHHTLPQPDRVYIQVPKTTFTYGDPPFTMTASGGTGTGEYLFGSNTYDVIMCDGDKAYITGSGTTKVYATKLASGNYGPSSSYGSGWKSITVKPKDVNIERSYKLSGNEVILTCKLTGYVKGDLPAGKVEISADNVVIREKSFKDSDTFQSYLTISEVAGKKIKVKYTPSKYDNYNGATIYFEINTGTQVTATPTPTPTPKPTATPTPKQTATPTPEPTAAPTATPTAEPVVTPTDEPSVTEGPVATDTPDPGKTDDQGKNQSVTPVPSDDPSGKNNAKFGADYYILIGAIIVLTVATAGLVIAYAVIRKRGKKK